MPGFALKGDTTMTNSDIGISIVEWRDEFVDDADNRESFISPAYLGEFGNLLPPRLNTAWIEKDESNLMPGGGKLGTW